MKRWFISFLSYFWGRIKHDFGWYPLFDHIVLYKYSNGIPYLSFFFFFFFLKNLFFTFVIDDERNLLKNERVITGFSFSRWENVATWAKRMSYLYPLPHKLSSWSFCSLSSRFWKILRLHSNHNVIVEARLPKKKIELCWRMPPAGNRAKYLQSP